MKMNHDKLDEISGKAAFLCAIHCIALPLLIMAIPFLAASFFTSLAFEWILFGLSAILGTLSVCWGYKRHSDKRVFAILSVAVFFILCGLLTHSHEAHHVHDHFTYQSILMFLGGISMSLAHFFNRKLCNSCEACHSNH
jgi:hypothetical protein